MDYKKKIIMDEPTDKKIILSLEEIGKLKELLQIDLESIGVDDDDLEIFSNILKKL